MCKDGKAWGHRHTDHLPTAGSLERGIIFGWLGDLGRDMVDKLAVATQDFPGKKTRKHNTSSNREPFFCLNLFERPILSVQANEFG